MNAPVISICIAAHKAEKFIEATLRSVQAQTYKNWELIITEDGSNDRTKKHVDDFACLVNQRVLYLRHDDNRGPSATRNTSITATEGDWVAFLDADDLWKPEHLDDLVSTSQIEEGDAVFTGTVVYDDATWTKLRTCTPSAADLANLPLALFTGRLSIMSSAVMIKRTSLTRFGPFAQEFKICNDTEYWLRLLSKGGSLNHTGATTCIYRSHNAALSRNTQTVLIENARVCERYAREKTIPRIIGRTRTANLYRCAGRELLAKNPNAALDSFAHALHWQPFHPKTIALWAKAFFKRNHHHRHAA